MCFRFCYCNKEERYYLIENECGICLEALKKSKVIKMSGCNHIFHKDCIQGYVNQLNENHINNLRCPYCNREQKRIFDKLNKNIFK